MQRSFLETFRSHAQTQSEKTALQVKRNDSYVRYSYGRFYSAICAISGKLSSIGVRKGANVGLFSENCPEWVVTYFGIHASGATVVPFDAQYTERELTNLTAFAGIEVMFCSAGLYDKVVKELAPKAGIKSVFMIDAEGPDSISSFPPSEAPAAERAPDDVMSIIFTSGTTGDPKGVMLTDENLFANVESIMKWRVIREDDVVLSILPLHHCFSFTCTILLELMTGATITFQPSLKGPDILAAINETGVTKMAGVPQLYSIFEKNIFAKVDKLGVAAKKMFRLLFALSAFCYDRFGWRVGKYLFGKVHRTFGDRFDLFVSGGAKLDPGVARNFMIFGFEIIEGFGLSETAPVLTLNPPGGVKIGSCGKAIPGVDLKIVNPDKDGVGEIAARGANVMKGYYKHPESTAEVIRDGWFYTGDLGYIDSDGYLFITGRAKDVIVMASGKNVYPEEVEKHYQQCPYVAEMCVMAAESEPGKVEKLRAIVVPNYRLLRENNIANCSFHIKCAFEDLAQKVPSYMRVTDFKIISEELPRTRLGKLKRTEIRKRGLFDREADDAVKKPEMTPEEKKMMEHPLAEKLVERIKQLTGKAEAYPGDNLEIDLGIDSLTRIELMVILDSEFGLKLKQDESASLIQLRDILEKVIAAGVASGASSEGFIEAVKKDPEVPLESAYPLRPGLFGTFVKWLARTAIFAFLRVTCGLEVSGLEKLRDKKAFLLCPNHTSYIDPVLMFLVMPGFYTRRMFFIGLEEMFGGFWFGWFRRLFRVITTGTEDSMIRSLQYSSKVLDRGLPLCIFPEGRITADGKIGSPKKGFAILACEHDVPVYPVHIFGASNIFSRTNPGFRRTKLRVMIGDPIYPSAELGRADGAPAGSEAGYGMIMNLWSSSLMALEFKNSPRERSRS